jgi:hypothetical protein
MPKSRWMSFVAKRVVEGSVSGVEITTQLLESYKSNIDDPVARSKIQLFCATISAQMRNGRWSSFEVRRATSSEFERMLFGCAVWLGNAKLSRRFLSTTNRDVTGDMFTQFREPLMAKFSKFRELLFGAFCNMGTITAVWKRLRDF